MANYSPHHFEPRAKAVNVKGVANRAVATVLTAGLIAQPLMSPLAAIAAPSTDNGDSVQGGGSAVENTVVAGNQAVAKTAAQLAEESAKQLKDAQAAYDADRIARRSRHAKPGFPQKFKGQFHQKDFRCRRKRHAASCLRHGADQIARQKLRMKCCRRHIKPRKSKCQKSRLVTDQPQKSDDPFITVVIVRRLKLSV